MPPKSNRNPTNRTKNNNENLTPRPLGDHSAPNPVASTSRDPSQGNDLATVDSLNAPFDEVTNIANLPPPTTVPLLNGAIISNSNTPLNESDLSPGDEPDDDATVTSSTHSLAPLDERYDLRSSTSDSIYNQMESLIFSKPLFLGHEQALKDVTLTLDRKNNGTFLKDGVIYKTMVFGEVAPRAHGTRTTARGDKRPPNDPVRTAIWSS